MNCMIDCMLLIDYSHLIVMFVQHILQGGGYE
jgi:hypothetical protein